jgi:hypothetical protein
MRAHKTHWLLRPNAVDGSELKWQANTEKVAIMIEVRPALYLVIPNHWDWLAGRLVTQAIIPPPQVYRRHCLDIELQWALEGKDIDDGLS